MIFLVQCTSNDKSKTEVFARNSNSDTATLLFQYWTLADADNPLGRDIIGKQDGKDFMPGIVFIQNGELVENPAGQIQRGKYERFNDSIHVNYDDGEQESYIIKRINTDSMFLQRKTDNLESTLLYNATDTWWPDVATNPFTKENMAWTIKPKQEETTDQIRQRCKDYVRFCQYYLEGYSRGGATKISFVGIPNIFNYYTGGISIPSDENLNPKWVDCFFNHDQAMEAYAMIRHVVIMKYDWDKKETNWIVQTPPVLKAMRDSL